MLPRRIEVALRGDLEKFMRDELKKAERAVKAGIEIAGRELKEELRAQVRSAGLGNRVANAWRHAVYPTGKPSLNAAASVYSNAPAIHTAFDRGETVRSPKGVWLAIPTENAPQKIGFKAIKPSTFPESQFGKLRFVQLKGRKDLALLVVDKLRRRKGKRGGFTKASATALRKGDFEDSIPMFWLIPEAKLKKKTDVFGAARRWEAQIPRLIDQEFEKLDAADRGRE
ncbi:MAG: DUF6441 family protein [Pikeienuella sp.]|uniref:DUF6441 family protein n=1 Tax=Pikeienuella sp. TaxID=2831957 RepID=UPI00391BB732